MSNAIIAFITVLGVLFFISAVYMLSWAFKTGQFNKLEEGAKVIFDKDEPMGEQTDFFPAKRAKTKKAKVKPAKAPKPAKMAKKVKGKK